MLQRDSETDRQPDSQPDRQTEREREREGTSVERNARGTAGRLSDALRTARIIATERERDRPILPLRSKQGDYTARSTARRKWGCDSGCTSH